MKTIILEIGDKKYTSSKVTCGISKEAMLINKEAIEFGKLGQSISENKDNVDMNMAESLFDRMIDLSNRKVNLICKVFGDKFTADEVENNLDNTEIDNIINNIIYGISGVITKN